MKPQCPEQDLWHPLVSFWESLTLSYRVASARGFHEVMLVNNLEQCLARCKSSINISCYCRRDDDNNGASSAQSLSRLTYFLLIS